MTMKLPLLPKLTFDLVGIFNVLMCFLNLYWGNTGLSVVSGLSALGMLWAHVRHERRMAEADRQFFEDITKERPPRE